MFNDGTTLTNGDNETSPVSYANHSTTWTPTDGMTPISTAPSRKRSRDENAFEVAEAEGSYFNPPEPIPEEPLYGEGMVLLNPATGRALSAETQTGTWFEDKAAEEEASKQKAALERPKLPVGRKSVRMSEHSMPPVETNGAPASPPKSTPTTESDEATIALGIGWRKVSTEDPDLQAAARGWARYLEVHYSGHIHNAEILLKNTSLDAYLVGSQEGFFLFTEDLLRGQLVGRTWEISLDNLRAQPMQFEGSEILQAARTPGPESRQLDVKAEPMNNWQDWNKINTSQTVAAGGMDLD